MKLYTKSPLQFIGLINKVAKTSGAPFQLAAFGNPATFERFEFFVSDAVDYSALTEGQSVIVEFEVTRSGFKNQLNIVRLVPARVDA